MFKLDSCLICLLCYVVTRFGAQGKVSDEDYDLMPKLFHLDDFESCLTQGKKAFYCTATIQLAPTDAKNASRVWKIIQEVNKSPKSYRHDQLRHGICVPRTCPAIDITANNTEINNGISLCYTSKYHSLGLNATATEIHCETDQPYHPIDNYDVAVGVIFGILIGIVIVSTFYEGLARYKPQEDYYRIISTPVGRIANCFSLPANWSRLMKDTSTTEDPAFKGINGIRFYNAQLVLLAHVAMISAASPVMNPRFVENLTRDPSNILFINGACNIQTFFLVAGYLTCYKFLLFMEKHQTFQLRYLMLAFINRYIRLTPCLLVMIAFNSTWLYHFSRGPMWDRLVGNEYRNCRRNWWATILYINNYYDLKNICMQHSWYLATDTQLFVAALLLVALIWKYPRRTQLILGTGFAIGATMTSLINYYNDFDIVVRHYPESFYHLFLNVPEWLNVYASCFTNFGGYSLGMFFGYLVYKKSKTNAKPFAKKIYVVIWWILIWGLPLGVIHYGILIYQDDYQHTRIGAAIYVSLQKNLFALGISLFIYGVTEGIGWFMRDCINWAPVQILGRLTYCTYLVHVAVIRVRGGQVSTPTYMSNYWILTQTAGDAVVSYIFAALLALFVEFPVSALQKLTIPQLTETEFSKSPRSEVAATVPEVANKGKKEN